MVDTTTLARLLEFRISGGESNTNPFLSIGGAMSNVLPEAKIIDNTFDNVWDDITVWERLAGETSFRWIYLYNNSLETLDNVRMYFSPADGFTSATFIKLGVMVAPDLLEDEYHAPVAQEVGSATDPIPAFTGITDDYNTTKEFLLRLGPLQWIAICLKRTLPVNTDSQLHASYRLVMESRTV